MLVDVNIGVYVESQQRVEKLVITFVFAVISIFANVYIKLILFISEIRQTFSKFIMQHLIFHRDVFNVELDHLKII